VTSTPKGRVRLNFRLLPALIVLLIILQLAIPYQGWMVLLVGLGGAALIAWRWALSLARSLEFKREMRFGWAQVGDRLEERFTLSNSSVFPALWAEVVDHSAMPDYRSGRVTGVDGRSSIQWRTQSLCTHRGVFTLGPSTLRTGDPFSLFSVSVDSPSSTTLMVLPPVIPLPDISVAPGGRAGEGRPRTNAPEPTVSAAGVREYFPGDSVRWVHWLTTARRGSLFVRSFDNTPSSNWWIVLDLDRRIQAGAGQDSTEEHAITLAASLADRGIREGQQVGLVSYGEGLVWSPPRSGDPQRWSILRELALLKPGPVTLAQLLERARPAVGQYTSLIVITAAAGVEDGVPAWLDALLLLKRRGVAPTVLLLDRDAYEPAPASADPAPAAQQGAASNGRAQRTAEMLIGQGIASIVVGRALFDRPELRPGHQGEWEWRILPTGMVAPVRQPRSGDLDWRSVA
jgi:uncharacterized protein (DUF58 family)